jgi:branched-subunit amino acid aminotransferase/4-amino-4-deoxychorismate lyase
MANVFWETDGKLFTPSLKTGCLPGTTREYVLENVECEEVEASIEELKEADRIFLTSAGIGIVTVAYCNERRLDISEHRLPSLFPGSN